MKRVSFAVLVAGALFVLGGVAAPAGANFCALSVEKVGNYKERVPNSSTGACQSPGTVGKEKFIIVKSKGNLIAPGVACAEVGEPQKGNYADSSCTTGVTPGTGAFIKIKVVQKGFWIARWFVAAKDAAGLPASVQIKEIVGGKATLRSKIGGAEVKFNMTGAELIGVKLEGEGKLSTGGQVKFTGVTTELNGAPSAVCRPLGTSENDSTLGVTTSNKSKGGLVLHEGDAAVTQLKPETGNVLGRLFFGEECSLPEEVPIITDAPGASIGNGLVLTDPLGVGNELAEHEITEHSLTTLYAISETAEHKATVEGKAKMVLSGAHSGLKWSGGGDEFEIA